MALDPAYLPPELHLTALSYLNKYDLTTCSVLNTEWRVRVNTSELWKKMAEQVLTQWQVRVNDSELWKKMAEQVFKCSLNVSCAKDFIKEYTYKQVNTKDQIVDRIEKFLKKIQLGQKAKWTCFLGERENCQTISVEILSITPDQRYQFREIVYDYEFDFEDSCFSSNKLIQGELSTSVPFNHHFPYNHRYSSSLELEQTVTYICTDSYRACMRFPCGQSLNLAIKIENLMQMKLNQLEKDQQHAKTVFGAIGNFFRCRKRKDQS